jgi:hypothetical protein
MKDQSPSNQLAAITVAALLLLATWGNAAAMLALAALGLTATVFLMRKDMARGGVLAATVGLGVAIGFSLILSLR